MNFEKALQLIVHHRDRSRARDAYYKSVAQTREHRHRAIREERDNQWRAQHNVQRFQHQQHLAQQRDMAQMQRDQYRADQEQQQKEAEERRMIDNINSEIQQIENNPGLTEEEKRDLTWRLRQKKMGLTPASPPDQPNYPPEKGIGMNWKDESGEFWPPGHPNEGDPIYVWYTRDNRHQVSVVRHEGDEWHKKENERKRTDAETAREEREAREEKRAGWERKSTDSLTALLTHPDTTPEEQEEIKWILEQREKEDAKNNAANEKTAAAEAKQKRADMKEKAERIAKRRLRRKKDMWRKGYDFVDGRTVRRPKDEEGQYSDEEPDWDLMLDNYIDEELEKLEAEEEAELLESDPGPHPSPLTGRAPSVASSEVPTNPETGMLEIV